MWFIHYLHIVHLTAININVITITTKIINREKLKLLPLTLTVVIIQENIEALHIISVT